MVRTYILAHLIFLAANSVSRFGKLASEVAFISNKQPHYPKGSFPRAVSVLNNSCVFMASKIVQNLNLEIKTGYINS